MSNGKRPPIPGRSNTVSVMSDLSDLDRNDLDGAVSVYRKALKLKSENRLRDDLGDVLENLLMLQDVPDILLARFKTLKL
jgi:hypothetical protein